jgi:hypothetical protein
MPDFASPMNHDAACRLHSSRAVVFSQHLNKGRQERQ